MTQEEAQYLTSKIDTEGFEYTFMSYSNFENIVDEEFHRLRKEYKEACERLNNYITQHFFQNEQKVKQ